MPFLVVSWRSFVFLVWVADLFCSSQPGSLCSAFSVFCKVETLVFIVCVAEIMVLSIWSLENTVLGCFVVTVAMTPCDAKLSMLSLMHLVVPCGKSISTLKGSLKNLVF